MNEKEINKTTRKKATAASVTKRTYRKRTADAAVAESEAKIVTAALRTRQPKEIKRTPVKIIPLGGLNEIGKNMTVFMCSNDMFILDCGLTFPDADMPGVDIVIPDFTYVLENKDKIKGLFVTHGHEDHIGAIPYLLRNFNLPIYATRLTIGLMKENSKSTVF